MIRTAPARQASQRRAVVLVGRPLSCVHKLPDPQRRAMLSATRGTGLGRRIYELCAIPAGGHPAWGRAVVSAARIRAVAVVEFRRLFGREPSFSFASPGRRAEAWDDCGNRLVVEQLNDIA